MIMSGFGAELVSNPLTIMVFCGLFPDIDVWSNDLDDFTADAGPATDPEHPGSMIVMDFVAKCFTKAIMIMVGG